jgi:hemerythrin-like metal-binding protein
MLFHLVQELHSGLKASARSRGVPPVLHRLARHTTAHCAHEECLMRSSGYPLYEWHRRQHLAIRSQVDRLARSIRRRRQQLAVAHLNALGRSLANHIRLADRMLGAYLRNYQRAQAVKGPPSVARAAQLDGC